MRVAARREVLPDNRYELDRLPNERGPRRMRANMTELDETVLLYRTNVHVWIRTGPRSVSTKLVYPCIPLVSLATNTNVYRQHA